LGYCKDIRTKRPDRLRPDIRDFAPEFVRIEDQLLNFQKIFDEQLTRASARKIMGEVIQIDPTLSWEISAQSSFADLRRNLFKLRFSSLDLHGTFSSADPTFVHVCSKCWGIGYEMPMQTGRSSNTVRPDLSEMSKRDRNVNETIPKAIQNEEHNILMTLDRLRGQGYFDNFLKRLEEMMTDRAIDPFSYCVDIHSRVFRDKQLFGAGLVYGGLRLMAAYSVNQDAGQAKLLSSYWEYKGEVPTAKEPGVLHFVPCDKCGGTGIA
jgi:hypothetical protein